jgi:hypothetical protein
MTVFSGTSADERPTNTQPRIHVEQYPAIEPPAAVKLSAAPGWARNGAITGATWTAFVVAIDLFVEAIPYPIDIAVFGLTGIAWITLATFIARNFIGRHRIARAEQRRETWQRAREVIQSVIREEVSAMHDRINLLQLEMGRQHKTVAEGVVQYGDERATASVVAILSDVDVDEDTGTDGPTVRMVAMGKLRLIKPADYCEN